jgi:hypothetical protein
MSWKFNTGLKEFVTFGWWTQAHVIVIIVAP